MELAKSDNGRWKPGQSGNLNGRPPGHHTRHRFSVQFMEDLTPTWAQYGRATMEHCARTDPALFFSVCSKIIPKDLEVTVRQQFSYQLDPADIEILKAIRDSVRNVEQRQLGEVFTEVLNAIKANNAQLIDAPQIGAKRPLI
jgi:hypothetical protein